jgi:hypothetical protein
MNTPERKAQEARQALAGYTANVREQTAGMSQDQLYDTMQKKRDALLAVALKIEALKTVAIMDGMPDWLYDTLFDADRDLVTFRRKNNSLRHGDFSSRAVPFLHDRT